MATQFSVKDDIKWKGRFFTIWGGQALSLLGSQLVGFALIWYLTVESKSAVVLATSALVMLLPRVIISPFIGPLVDRWNRRVTMMVADTVVALATLVLAILFASGKIEFWHIYLSGFIRAVAGSFHGTSMVASTSLMVPTEHLTRIQGINQMLDGGLGIVAAPLGALLLDLLPIQGILAIDIVTALFAIIPLIFLTIPQPDRSESLAMAGEESSFWQEFSAGYRYLVSWKGLLIVAIMATLINFLLTPAFTLLPLLVNDYFGKKAIDLGKLEALFGFGVIAGGILLGVWGGFERRIVTAMVGLFGMGIGTLVIGIAPSSRFTWAIGGAIFMGLFHPIMNGSIMGLIQASVSPDMQGRVFTLIGSVTSGMAPIGLALSGPISESFGIQTWFILGGLACIMMGLISFMIPAVMNLEERGQELLAENGEKSLIESPAPASAD